MKVTGEKAVDLAMRYGLPIHKRADATEGYREAVPLEDAQEILRHGDPETIYTEAEPDMIAQLQPQRIPAGTNTKTSGG